MVADLTAGKRYDRAYFDRLYRNRATRVITPSEVQRQVVMVVSMAEYLLGRPVSRVLDVGCGEGSWRAPLLKLRPKLYYLGIDTSDYVLDRFGHSRNIHPMAFEQLAEQRFNQPFDLIICANVLQYLGAGEIRRGLSGFAELLDGMAFIETYARGDRVQGDQDGFKARTANWYRKAFAEAGLIACGPQSWLSSQIAADLSALELPA